MKLHIHWYEFASSGRADLVWSNSERALGRVYVTTAKCRCGKVRMSLRNLVATDPLPPSIGSVRDDVHDGPVACDDRAVSGVEATQRKNTR